MTLKGLPILVGVGLILLNFIVQFIPAMAWFANCHFFLHLGLVILIGDIW